jgi:hypothetical protein
MVMFHIISIMDGLSFTCQAGRYHFLLKGILHVSLVFIIGTHIGRLVI